jgi:hypothetical protein
MSQGLPARTTCPSDILVSLIGGDIGFEDLVTKLEKKYSRGTVSKYLNELYIVGKVQRRGIRGMYYLTPNGLKEAKKQGFIRAVQILTPEVYEQFILNYKSSFLKGLLITAFGDHYYHFSEKAKAAYAQIMETPEPENESAKKQVEAIEKDLSNYGFSDDQIVKLWLINKGNFLFLISKNLGFPLFFGLHNFKITPNLPINDVGKIGEEAFKVEIKEKLRSYSIDDL